MFWIRGSRKEKEIDADINRDVDDDMDVPCSIDVDGDGGWEETGRATVATGERASAWDGQRAKQPIEENEKSIKGKWRDMQKKWKENERKVHEMKSKWKE